jgi:DNA-binding PadR family transcriptional regulator
VKPRGLTARMIKTIIVGGALSGPKTNPESFLPLRPLDLELLLALAESERHGYGLVQEIARRTDGLIRLEPGNLYRVIRRLLADGLVAQSTRRPAPDLADERRRYFRITAFGELVVAAEVRRLRALVTSAAVRAFERRVTT